jgi:hypothetical protein
MTSPSARIAEVGELKRPAEQKVADQHARLVAPHRVGGGVAAAELAVVDHVVMQQRRGVDEFDAGGEVDMAPPGIAAELGGGQRQHRAQPLAARGDDMAGELGDQHHRALHPLEDDGVDVAQVLADQGMQGIERTVAAGALLYFALIQPNDGAHGKPLLLDGECLKAEHDGVAWHYCSITGAAGLSMAVSDTRS